MVFANGTISDRLVINYDQHTYISTRIRVNTRTDDDDDLVKHVKFIY